MKIIKTTVSDVTLKYALDNIAPLSEFLFIDIETTGFAAKNSNLYLIGTMYYEGNCWTVLQFFADDYEDEQKLLESFIVFAAKFKYLIHFNGNNFDIPYLQSKMKSYNLSFNFDQFTGIDIYKRICHYRAFLKLDNCKQKTIEQFLGIFREDKFTGGDLIGIYHNFAKTHDTDMKDFLILHNYEDLKGMLRILPILSYSDLFCCPVTVTKVQANYYLDQNGEEKCEILMYFTLPSPFPAPVSYLYDKCYFTGTGNEGMLKVPMYSEEMKFFYANYKDYYYLPFEDIALHKAVASFVDKDHRVPAKASNCYTRKVSNYLPEWSDVITPFFKRDYLSNDLFFELTDERRTDRDLFNAYVPHVLGHMCL